MRKTDGQLTYLPMQTLFLALLLFFMTVFLALFLVSGKSLADKTKTLTKNALELHCEKIGALTKAFAEARDNGQAIWQAQRQLNQVLDPDKKQQHATKKLLSVPGGLAYSQKHLSAVSLFGLGKYLCMSSTQKINRQLSLKYLIESAAICQQRMPTNNKIYACIKLAYQLLLQKQQPVQNQLK